ncbi:ACP S-malonyltransferase [Tepidibacillus infernus]|uniref:ACP S-malonyltransferase n=1 Tax=Tepidibacillus infernus TaxID=1806172 RepID=UPI003B7122CC
MQKIAIIFPGQGSQYVGMGSEFYKEYPSARETFQQADEWLGYSLSGLMFNGPEEDLRLTVHTQPAILTASLAIWNVVKEMGVRPDFVAGHSLGEYSALTAAEGISFKDALQAVKKRGQWMEEAVPNGEGTMAAIMGMEKNELDQVCREITEKGHIVELANLNTPNQIVISGSKTGVEMASQEAKAKGARRVIPLAVSGPFHSRLMKPAKEKLQSYLNETKIVEPIVPVVMNVTGKPETNPVTIKHHLVEQVVSPVLWTDSIEWMIDQGIDTFVEVGPGKVLTGLVKKINNQIQTYSIEDITSFENFKNSLK